MFLSTKSSYSNIFERSCDTGDWSNDAENSVINILHLKIYYNRKLIIIAIIFYLFTVHWTNKSCFGNHRRLLSKTLKHLINLHLNSSYFEILYIECKHQNINKITNTRHFLTRLYTLTSHDKSCDYKSLREKNIFWSFWNAESKTCHLPTMSKQSTLWSVCNLLYLITKALPWLQHSKWLQCISFSVSLKVMIIFSSFKHMGWKPIITFFW